jgi:hypothetical protein
MRETPSHLFLLLVVTLWRQLLPGCHTCSRCTHVSPRPCQLATGSTRQTQSVRGISTTTARSPRLAACHMPSSASLAVCVRTFASASLVAQCLLPCVAPGSPRCLARSQSGRRRSWLLVGCFPASSAALCVRFVAGEAPQLARLRARLRAQSPSGAGVALHPAPSLRPVPLSFTLVRLLARVRVPSLGRLRQLALVLRRTRWRRRTWSRSRLNK